MHIFRKSTNTNAFGAYSYFGVTPEGHIYHWLMIHNAQLGDKFDPRTARVEIVGLTRTQGNISPAKVDQFMADTLARPFNGTPPTSIKRTTRRSYGQPWRGLLIEALIDNGGYGGHRRGESSSIAYDVPLYGVDASYDNIRKVMLEHFPATSGYPPLPEEDWDENRMFEIAADDARRQVLGGDDIYYRTLSPATARRYGLREDIEFEVAFSLEGRGGKHLCVTEFEGRDLYDLDLVEALQEQTGENVNHSYGRFTNEWCRRLLAVMSEWEQLFTRKNAEAEVEHQLAFQMMLKCCDLQDAAEAAAIEAAHVQEWAERDVVTTTTTKE